MAVVSTEAPAARSASRTRDDGMGVGGCSRRRSRGRGHHRRSRYGDPLWQAIAAAACAAAAVAALESHWLADAGTAAYAAVPGALLAASVILAFTAMLSAAARGADGTSACGSACGNDSASENGSPPVASSTSGDRGRKSGDRRRCRRPARQRPVMPTSAVILVVLAMAAAAPIVLVGITAPPPFHLGHPGILDAMAACHATEAGCGRDAIAGDGAQAHILAPAPVITTVGVPATVSISGVLPPDARPPVRVTVVVSGPDGARNEHAVMSTPAGRYSLHVPVMPPSAPGTHEYAIAASYDSRDLGAVAYAGTAPFTVMVLQPEISRSDVAPEGPPAWLDARAGGGAMPAGFPRGADGSGGSGGMGGAGGGHPAGPASIVDGIVSFDPPLPPASASAGQVVNVRFTYTDGMARESFAYVRGPAPDYERLAEPSYAGSAGPTPAEAASYRFIVQPTWQPGEYGVVVAYGADGARDAAEATTTAGILPVNVGAGAAPAGNETVPAPSAPFSCITIFGRIGPGIDHAPLGGGDGGDEAARHGRASGCYAGTIRAVLGPDTLDIDGRPVTLTVSNARGGSGGGAADSGTLAADRLRELCRTGTAALVDRDETLAVDSREPHPTIRAGYYSTVWCLGPSGGPYGGASAPLDPVNTVLLAEGLAEADPVGCLSSERRLEWPECDTYTAVEQAVGGAVSAAIDAVSSAAGGGGGTETDGSEYGGDCAIATAAYGTPAAPYVQSLREWRDLAAPDAAAAVLAGPALDAYYAVSPAIADVLRDSPPARTMAAAALYAPAAIASYMAGASVHHHGSSSSSSGGGPPPSPWLPDRTVP